MFLEDLTAFLLSSVLTAVGTLEPPPPPAPAVFPGFFLFFFFIPTYLVLMGVRSAFIDFRGWLLPRQAARLAISLNLMSTLLLAGFLPGWLTTIAVHLWFPELSSEQAIWCGLGGSVVFAVAHALLLVRRIEGLAEELGKGYWHAVPMGGFFLCFYVGIFLYSGEAILAAFSFLFAPLGGALILPFAVLQAQRVVPAPETLPACVLCTEPIALSPVYCSRCDAPYHSECWDHGEGCSRKSCRGDQESASARG